jgi:hypothetical protein
VDGCHVGAPAELSDNVLNAAGGVRAAFAAEDRPARLPGQLDLDSFERLARLTVASDLMPPR